MPVAAQVASAAAGLPQASVEQHVGRQEAPVPPRTHHHHNVSAGQGQSYANNDAYQSPERSAPRPVAVDPTAGEVVAINAVQEPEPTTGLGAVGGAVAGGLLGNQVGGGLAGNGIEHAVRKATSYQVQVRMQDGTYRNINYSTQPQVQVGERVHVSGDSLSAS